MCSQTMCGKCGKPTWRGCGRHVEQALADMPREARCRCREQEAGPAEEAAKPRRRFGFF